MTDRTTISCSRETKALLDELRDGQPWNEFLQDLAEGDTNSNEFQGQPLTADDVSLIAGEVADEVENRMIGR
jgi:hypothetical protein